MYFNITEDDIFLFHQGTHYHSQQILGCHNIQWEGNEGYRFAVWAPNAKKIYVIGDFNEWNGEQHPLVRITNEGIWVGFFTNIPLGTPYKYKIVTENNEVLFKSDPFALQSELRPANASLICEPSTYEWNDFDWQEAKLEFQPFSSPISVYEVHLGSWKKKKDEKFYTYCELADELIPYVKSLGFTHIELLPLAEHPFDLSWGYQITGYFSVTSRYGSHNDFKYFIDMCHQNGLGVIIDWVPGHFCKDDFGLREFDGKPIYEYQDSRKAEKRSWGTLTFDFGRPEVQSFLISNALFWLEEYHLDGIRVDAVASMLYLNFDRYNGEEKMVNSYGGEENLEAYAFIRKLNEVVFSFHPSVLMMAEDSSDVPLVTSPAYLGGLGFNYKWNMGWMNDILNFMKKDPIYRKWHHHLLTFSFMYTHSENFLLPLSHDEVVHGKKSLLDKMPGDQWQQFANLRLLYGYMFVHPGKKLLFMGSEFAQYAEWKDQEQLDWHLLEYPLHNGIFHYVKSLNHFYLQNPALYELDHQTQGFDWIDPHNIDQSTIVFRRCGKSQNEELIIICNFTPNVSYDYKVGVCMPGTYKEIFNSDASEFGGSGQLNKSPHYSIPNKWHGLPQHIKIKVPPLAITVFKREITTIEEEVN
ncbi:1,4-alpha-glucan branching protein GlgB [Bacillus sp. FJAT-49732]|uniref:1,4-alpha-glucan branching enzyme GlgB n=1 Tax=Lederbergia citrisecunda TaxID=2833583 RepID=A0A942YKA6_9BACI|nr:1,4-alpha-glucan branching protein GlgB [Lederbergia citrisecunda]MBS4199039.1 1,4-alpha-glucan branching protein GlgB [Lederbergia citrisecunda]